MSAQYFKILVAKYYIWNSGCPQWVDFRTDFSGQGQTTDYSSSCLINIFWPFTWWLPKWLTLERRFSLYYYFLGCKVKIKLLVLYHYWPLSTLWTNCLEITKLSQWLPLESLWFMVYMQTLLNFASGEASSLYE